MMTQEIKDRLDAVLRALDLRMGSLTNALSGLQDIRDELTELIVEATEPAAPPTPVQPLRAAEPALVQSRADTYYVTRPVFRKFNAYCLDDRALAALDYRVVRRIELTDENTGQRLEVSMEQFGLKSFMLNEGQGPQHGLLIHWWRPVQPAEQMPLALGEEARNG